MRHLIVEACIARNLLDTSAYLWPGYVNGHINQIPQCMPAQVPGWSSFMKGAPLTSVMVNALVSSPATRYDRVFLLIQSIGSYAYFGLYSNVLIFDKRIHVLYLWYSLLCRPVDAILRPFIKQYF